MIAYEDDNWLVVNKPTGLSTHAAVRGGSGLVEWLELHHNLKAFVCCRLDKGTSGVLLFAKTKKASSLAQDIHETLQAEKTYHFISHRPYKGKEGKNTQWTINEPLAGKECSTQFRFIESGHGCYCYEAVIKRGRTHQIRQHAALSGVPILGDEEYGGRSFSRLCLHSSRLNWPGISAEVTAQFPDSFTFLLKGKERILQDAAVAWERRMGWPGTVSNSYRLIHRGELDLPVSIDIYDAYLSIAAFSEQLTSGQLKSKLAPVCDYLATKIEWRGALLRQHAKNPHRKKLIQDVICWGEPIPDSVLAREHDLFFEVNINDSQHVGLFLDQRDSRRRVSKTAGARRVANLFSFTCSFSAAALAGGAEVVFSVDLAGSTLARGKENFAINGLDQSGRGKFIQGDVCKWLSRQERKQSADPSDYAYWDLIICDPPVFASAGKGRGFHVEQQWPELARQIRLLLSGNGIALFANNHRGGKPAYYLQELEKHFGTVTQLSPPMDFPVLEDQPEHVRIYWCEV
ncbi:class I SAM-dependent methyltransferase [Desulfosediminicola ganghwensis]|uniref:class I SAM-dependent methyltransferase n=1 Tax=Desulfosediminicola ganghwensis TaxID=2569540 RepID=UPI0010AC3EEE|nr:class I SAM-dependent methyltransferase [Desulfosediminicola ganghwensis]